MQHARDRIREPTARRRLLLDVDKIQFYAIARLARFVAKRHKQRFAYCWQVVVYLSPEMLGLVSLNGWVVAPRPNRLSRAKPNAAR